MGDTPPRHIQALDGIRGLAVILVFIYHAFLTTVKTDSPVTTFFHGLAVRCWIGVDLFFVLSGFLITGILLRAKNSTNYYRVFYARRALRIMPLYYVVMFGGMLAFNVHPPIRFQLWFWFNFSNVITAFYPMLIACLSHYWSLAIEEQFYFAWPAVVRKASPRALAWLCMAAIIGCFLVRNLPIVITWNDRWPDLVYRLTPFRIDTLCGGAFLAVLADSKMNFGRVRRIMRTCCIAGGAIFAISSLHTNWMIRFGFTWAGSLFYVPGSFGT